MAEPSWEFPEAWLLISAAGFGRRGCDLSHLIGTADAYNHDIPTEPMIERSIGRLAASGLMSASDDLRVRITGEGRSLVKQAKGGMFERAPRLLALLNDGVAMREGTWPLPPGAWQEAYDHFRHRMS